MHLMWEGEEKLNMAQIFWLKQPGRQCYYLR